MEHKTYVEGFFIYVGTLPKCFPFILWPAVNKILCQARIFLSVGWMPLDRKNKSADLPASVSFIPAVQIQFYLNKDSKLTIY